MLEKLRKVQILGMTPGDIILYTFIVTQNLISLFFDSIDKILPENNWPPWIFRVIVGFASLLVAFVYREQVRSNRREISEEVEKAKDKLARFAMEQAIKDVVHLVETTQNKHNMYRANMMLVRDGKLTMMFRYRMDSCPDVDLELEKNQGCAGQAWGYGQQICANLERQSSVGEPGWGLSPDLVARTQNLKAVLSTPVFSHDNCDEVIGVFNIDSGKLSFDQAGFQNEEVAKLVSMYAGSYFSLLIPNISY